MGVDDSMFEPVLEHELTELLIRLQACERIIELNAELVTKRRGKKLMTSDGTATYLVVEGPSSVLSEYFLKCRSCGLDCKVVGRGSLY